MATFVFGKTTGATGNVGFVGSEFTDGGAFDVNKLWDANEYDDLTASSTAVKFFDTDGKSFFELKGKGFAYIGETPIAGDVTTINLKEAGLTQATVTGLTGINLATLYTLSGSGVFGDGDSFLFMAELLQGNDTVKLTAFDDVLVEGWNSGNDMIFGLAGNDTLYGDDGNDTLDGGTGNDHMFGGKGDDVYIVDSSSDMVDETKGSGTDTVKSSVSFSLNVVSSQAVGDVENLVLTGMSNIDAIGNALVNTITGNGKNNFIEGHEGADTLDGGAGIDTVSYFGSLAGVTVSLNGKVATIGKGGDAEGESIVNFENITGSDNNDTLTGDKLANVLNGGSGADTLDGGLGNDVYVVDDLGDIVIEGLKGGTDTVQADISFSIETLTNVENLTLREDADDGNATGNAGKNIIIGNDGENTLNGMAGADVMLGGDDNDTYIVDVKGDKVTELVDEGTDTIQVSNDFLATKGVVTYSISAIKNVENLSYFGNSNFVGTGNALNNVIVSANGIDKLSGGDGVDTLNGKQGADILTGGKHSDVFVFDDVGGQADIVTDFALGDRIDITTFALLNAPGQSFEQLVTGGFLVIDTSTALTGQSSDSSKTNNTVISWDADGSAGSAATVQTLVTLEDYLGPLTAADFLLPTEIG